MAAEQSNYLAVLKASYDYDPQEGAEDELAIKENQLLFLLERTDSEYDWLASSLRVSELTSDAGGGKYRSSPIRKRRRALPVLYPRPTSNRSVTPHSL